MSKIKKQIDFQDDMYHLNKSFTKSYATIIKKIETDKVWQDRDGQTKK